MDCTSAAEPIAAVAEPVAATSAKKTREVSYEDVASAAAEPIAHVAEPRLLSHAPYISGHADSSHVATIACQPSSMQVMLTRRA